MAKCLLKYQWVSIAVNYDAVVSPVSEAVTNTAIASVVFTVEWDI